MKKNLAYILFLLCVGCSTVYAGTEITPNTNVIVLEEASSELVSGKDLKTLEYDKNDSQSPDQNIVPVLDLKGGVIKGEPEKPKTRLEAWLTGDYMTGDWRGFRAQLEEKGIKVGSTYMGGPAKKFRGGGMENRRELKGYGLYNLNLTLDTEKMGLWKGGTFYTLYQNKRGMGLTREYMGDRQTMDGYDFRTMNQLSEYWYQHVWKDGKYRLKAGKQDANAEFCGLYHGFDFLNLSFSVMPTTGLFPTYPEPAMGVTAAVSPTDKLTLKNGTFDTKGRGSTSGFNTAFNRRSTTYNITEAEFKTTIKKLPGRYISGYWITSKNVEDYTTNVDSSGDFVSKTYGTNMGLYSAFEQMVYKEKKDDQEDTQGLTLIGQLGFSPQDRNDVSRYFGSALHYKGLIPKRDNDVLGLGTAIAGFSNRLQTIDGRSGEEAAIECFYKIQLTPWLYIQPDIQYIINPNGMYKSSFAFALRTFFTL